VDLTSWLLRRLSPRPLVLTAPGGTGARVAVERFLREQGWPEALSPAGANMLVVAGGHFEPYVTRVWRAMPAPRVRVDVTADTDLPEALRAAVRLLHDREDQREQARPVEETPHVPAEHSGHAAMGHDHGHHMDDMEMPGGVPMADRAPDRDGLELDELHVPLGPALPLWPAGLTVHTRLQGDVIREATVEILGDANTSYWTPHPVAHRLDASARLLALTGWTDAATTAQRLRDEVLAGNTPPLEKWAARVRRSRTLRWLLTGVGQVDDAPASLAGDAHDRLLRWLAGDVPDETQWTVDNLPRLLAGAELAAARLLVASLAPDVDPLARGAHHG
jgi:hypothetical protein